MKVSGINVSVAQANEDKANFYHASISDYIGFGSLENIKF